MEGPYSKLRRRKNQVNMGSQETGEEYFKRAYFLVSNAVEKLNPNKTVNWLWTLVMRSLVI